MGYRLPPTPDQRVQIIETVTQSVIHVDNGVITNIAIPCFYDDGEVLTYLDKMVIDHDGWPNPGHPDASYQPCNHDEDTEINLEDEGYDSVVVQFIDPPEGLSGTGTIDGNIVRVSIETSCHAADEADMDVPFSIYLIGDSMKSAVTKGTLHIVAGPAYTQE